MFNIPPVVGEYAKIIARRSRYDGQIVIVKRIYLRGARMMADVRTKEGKVIRIDYDALYNSSTSR